MDIQDAANRWADAWKRGWENQDPNLIASVYADDALQRSKPFRDAGNPREYAEWAFSDELSAICWFPDPIVAGDRATAEWWAISTTKDGPTTIAGVSLLKFNAEGFVVEQKDYWSQEPGAREPYEGFGR